MSLNYKKVQEYFTLREYEKAPKEPQETDEETEEEYEEDSLLHNLEGGAE